MKRTLLSRGLVGLGITALAASALTAGLGTAQAAPQADPPSWQFQGFDFSRTVDNATPGVADTVRVTTRIKNAGGTGARTFTVKDVHPSCFRFVEGSARVDGQVENPNNVSFKDVDPDYPDLGYAMVHQGYPGWHGEHTFSFDYTVDECPAGQDLTTTLHFSGYHETLPVWRGDESFRDTGPTLEVQAAASHTQVTAPTSATVGKQTLVKANVSGGTVGKHGGDVEFFADGQPIGVGAVGSDGVASVSWTPGSAKSVALTARYGGNINTSPSTSAALTAEVSADAENTTTVVEAPDDARVGRSTTLTAAVTPAGAGGEVTFRENGTVISTARVTGSDGRVQIDWVPQTEGERTITAEFSGRTGFAGSQSAGRTVTVQAPAPDVVDSTITIDPVAGGITGQPVGLKARVSAAGGVAVDGTVTFKDGDRVIGTGTVQSGGLATVTWTPEYSGARTITAEYSGSDAVRASSTSLTVQVAGPDLPGGDNGGEGGEGGSGSLGGLGSLAGIFGSLGTGS